MSKLKFFKHFTDAHRGSSLQLLRQKHGMSAIGRYWTLVEICAEKMEKQREEEFTEAHCIFAFAKPYLTASLGYANLKQASSYLEALSELGLCSFKDLGDVWACSMPKLLECMDRDTKRARSERVDSAPKKKNKDKEIDKEEEKDISAEPRNLVPLPAKRAEVVSLTISENFQVEVSKSLIGSWADTFPKDFLDLEVKKARSWLLANQHKSPKKNFGRFFNSWFNRAWEDYRKTLKSNPTSITVDDLNDLLGAS